MKNPKLIISLSAILAGSCALPLRGAVVFDGTTWYAAGSSPSIALSGTALTVDTTATGGSGNFGLTYLTPKTLSVGESLTLTVDFSFTGADSNGTSLRFGLLNSGGAGSQINADGLGQTNIKYTNYTGYAPTFGNQSSSSANITSALWDRTSSSTALISQSSAYTANVSSNIATGVTPPLTTGNNYTLTLTLNYLSLTDLKVSDSLTGGSLSSAVTRSFDDATPIIQFDTIVLFSTSLGSSVMTYNAVHVSTVPEPTPAGLLLGAVGLLLLPKVRRLVGHRPQSVIAG